MGVEPHRCRRRALVASDGCTWLTSPLYRQEDLVPGNVASLQMGFEYVGPFRSVVG